MESQVCRGLTGESGQPLTKSWVERRGPACVYQEVEAKDLPDFLGDFPGAWSPWCPFSIEQGKRDDFKRKCKEFCGISFLDDG